MNLPNWFDGPSLLDSDGLCRCVVGRELRAGQAVDSYRNLNKPHCFSIKAREGAHKGLVAGYARSVVIASPSFVVGEKARLRIVREKRKNVHSYVRGVLAGMYEGDLRAEHHHRCIRVSYSPYIGPEFFTLERDDSGRPIPSSFKPVYPALLQASKYAIVNGSDVFLVLA